MKLRESNIAKLESEPYDVLIIGGGINGGVAAASLAARGVKVALIDRGDFAGCTSSNTSSLAWGGIKYLESYEFFLVRKLCMSRNHLMRNFPSSVQEIRFFTTIQKGFRFPAFLVFLVTLFYWVVGNFFTKAPRYLSKRTIERDEPVINSENASSGFEYSDAYLHDNDARFVFDFVRSAMTYGCVAANYVESLGGERKGAEWEVRAKDVMSGREFTVRANALINAAGPYVDKHNELTQERTGHHHLFSKGVHLLVDRVTPNRRVLTFFASDGRLFFVIPMGPKTCIGTTDTQVEDPATPTTEEDRQFILDNANTLLKLDKPLTKHDVIAERCGVRPLAVQGPPGGGGGGKADWVKLSRKHVIDVSADRHHLSIFGGKLTDCVNVGDEVSEHIEAMGIEIPYPKRKWYGEPPDAVKDEYLHQARLMDLDAMTDPSSSEPLSSRLWRRYGGNAIGLLENIREDPSMAELVVKKAEYIRCEIQQTARREMVTKLEDFLRRRSKIALVVRHADLREAPGVKEVSRIFFGDQAEEKWEEYFRENS